jgi:hypothetical protein
MRDENRGCHLQLSPDAEGINVQDGVRNASEDISLTELSQRGPGPHSVRRLTDN